MLDPMIRDLDPEFAQAYDIHEQACEQFQERFTRERDRVRNAIAAEFAAYKAKVGDSHDPDAAKELIRRNHEHLEAFNAAFNS